MYMFRGHLSLTAMHECSGPGWGLCPLNDRWPLLHSPPADYAMQEMAPFVKSAFFREARNQDFHVKSPNS